MPPILKWVSDMFTAEDMVFTGRRFLRDKKIIITGYAECSKEHSAVLFA